MLQGSFFKIVSEKKLDEVYLFDIEFRSDNEVFKGHFPNEPVVPGVFIIQIIHELVQNITKKKLMLKSARKIKFISPVIPGETNRILFEVAISENEKAYTVNVVANFTGHSCLKLNAVFAEL